MLVTELITGEEVYLKRWSVCCDNYSKIRKKILRRRLRRWSAAD